MSSFHRSAAGRALALVLCLQLGPFACVPADLLAATPGVPEYQANGVVAVPSGFVNAAGGNLLVLRDDLSIDTPLGTVSITASYNSSTREWRWSHEISYDGATFVDGSGAVHEVGALADGDPIEGTIWERVDADTLQTKGGLAHHFGPDGRLEHVRFATLAYPRIVYTPAQISQCTSATACAPLLAIDPAPNGRPASITDARTGRTASFGWDGFGRLASARTPQDVAAGLPGVRYEYASTSHLLVATVSSGGERVEYRYLEGGRVARVIQVGAGDPEHTFVYVGRDASDRFATIHFNPLGGRTRYRFDAQHRLLEVERADAGEITTFEWGGLRITRAIDPAGVSSEFVHAGDRLVAHHRPSGDTVRFAYASGGVNLESPDLPAVQQIEDGLGLVEERSYDALGRVAEVRNGELESVALSFSGASLTSLTAKGVTTSFPVFGVHGHWLDAWSGGAVAARRAFDPVGNPTVPGNVGQGGLLAQAFDADRRLASLQVAASDDVGHVTATAAIAIERGADGRITRVARPGGGDHEIGYDALGRAVEIRERVDGVWRITGIEYDAAGNQTARELPNGMREEYAYDVYGRMLSHRALRDGVLFGDATFVWSAGRLAARHDSIRGLTETYAYDAAGRLASTAFGLGETIANEYDARGRLTGEVFTLPGAGVVADIGYAWDLADRLVRITDRLADEVLVEDAIEGGLLRHTDTGNGLRRSYGYDASARLASAETRDAAGALLETTWVTRTIELSPARLEIASATTTPLATTQERYWLPPGSSLSHPDQLVGKRVFGWDDGEGDARAYAWDALGNPAATAAGDAFTYNGEGNRLVSATLSTGQTRTYTYDEAGFATSRSGVPITWTATGRMASYGSAEIVWDMAGRVVEATVAGETREFRRFGGRVESGLATLGVLDLGPVAIHLVTGERWYRHDDFRGQVSFVTDGDGEVAAHHRYRPFGLDATFGEAPDGISFERQPAFGPLVMMGARMFDPLIGRFLSPDPVFSWVNAYAYALGNPVWWEDRDGLAMSARAQLELGLKVAQVAAAIALLTALTVAAPPAAIAAIGYASAVGTAIVVSALLIDAGISAVGSIPPGVVASPPPSPAPPGPNPGKGGQQVKNLTLTIVVPAPPPTCSPLDVTGHRRTPYAALCLILLVNALAGAVWWRDRRREGPR
jgi:RHS repeat-associated protein